MIHQTYEWKSKDNKNLFGQSWTPDAPAKNTVLMVHGLGEHSGRYERWAELFVDSGLNFIAIDIRGHGKSEGKRGHARSMDHLLNDIDVLFDQALVLFPDTNLILYGHSMGGNLVLNYIINRNRQVKALIVTSPWLKLTKPPADFILSIARFLKKFLPVLLIPNGLNSDDISHDPEICRNYTKDPLNHNKISLKMFFEIHDGGLHALRNIYKINSPFLIMHGKADNITSYRASESYVQNTNNRTHLKLWEGQYHELHNEIIYKDVFEYIINWMKKYKLV